MAAIDQENFRNDPLDVNHLPKFEAVGLEGLEPRYLVKMTIGTSIWLLICIGILLLLYFTSLERMASYFPWIVVGVSLMFIWSYFSNFQLQKKIGYAVRERDLIFRRGFLSEKTTIIPFNRIQHVSTTRGMIDKSLGLSNLKVFTAGGSGSDINIPGLTPERANELKEALSERMSSHV